MSGGRFDYKQYQINMISEQIAEIIEKNNVKCSIYPRCMETYMYNSCECGHEFPDEVIQEFKNAVKALNIASIYAQRVDWFLSGDDGEESFFRRLKQELQEIK